jgi:uncharacterized protein
MVLELSELADPELQGYGVRVYETLTAHRSKLVTLETPLSDAEIGELDAFLMSAATSDECMDLVTLDGFLTALVVGPRLVAPSVWLPMVWGGTSEFESKDQAEWIISLVLRRMNIISSMFGENSCRFEPLLYEREGKGTRLWLANDWCFGFIRAMELGREAWDPLFDDKTNRVLLVPILTLGTQEGLAQIDAAADPASEYTAAVDMLHLSVEAIHAYWRLPFEKLVATRASQKPARNGPCPCGSGRKFKKCCALAS